jgi:hypothetical protein
MFSFVYSQDTTEVTPEFGWKNELVGGINLSQTSFSNWVEGGENSMAWQLNLNFQFVNSQKKFNWANSGKLTFGQIKLGKEEIRKSIDEIKLESIVTYKLGILVDPYIALTGQTQFAPGYNYETDPKIQISDFMDPVYFQESFGIEYEPVKVIKIRMGGAFKQTITNNFPMPFADDPKTTEIEKTKNEFGAELVTKVQWNISDNLILSSKLELFSTLEKIKRTDVNWDNLITAKISKYFNINFNTKIFYDYDISRKRQIKQALALGLTYSFIGS